MVVALCLFAAYYFAPESITQILYTFGYNFKGEFSGVTCGIAIAVLSKRIAKTSDSLKTKRS